MKTHQDFKVAASNGATWKTLPNNVIRVEQLDTWIGSSLNVDVFFTQPATVSKITWRGNCPQIILSPLFMTLDPTEQPLSRILNIADTHCVRLSCTPRTRAIGTHDRWLEFCLEYRL